MVKVIKRSIKGNFCAFIYFDGLPEHALFRLHLCVRSRLQAHCVADRNTVSDVYVNNFKRDCHLRLDLLLYLVIHESLCWV